MADRVYKWDIDNLETCKDRLRLERENLENNKNIIENLKIEIMKNWQSFSSEIYLDSLETDIDNLEYIIDAIEELEKQIGKVVTEVYQGCEDLLYQEIQRLSIYTEEL